MKAIFRAGLAGLLWGLMMGGGRSLMGGESPAALRPTNVIQLFNGRDLSGLHSWLVDTKRDDPRRVFTVANGLLRISGEGLGYLSTEREYRDYQLVAEFKWGQTNWAWGHRIGKARDSGIFLHSAGPEGNSYDGQGAFKAAIECNVFQGATGDFLLIRGFDADGSIIAPRLTAEIAGQKDTDNWPFWQTGGTRETLHRWGRLNWSGKDRQWNDQLDFRGARDVESPPGEWTRVECTCASNRIAIRVNGQLVNEAFDVSPSSGKILLQCEGSEIYFRKFELHPLPPSPAAGPAPGTRINLTDGPLFIPTGVASRPEGVDLTIHLHGAASTVERNFIQSRRVGVLVNVTLPGLSSVYAERFREPNGFQRILDETIAQLRELKFASDPRMGRVTVTSFSAGFGGVRALLNHETIFQRIDAIVMADSIYAGFEGDPAERKINPANMEGFLAFAREAVGGRKTLIITHTQLPTPSYASTQETADYLIEKLGGTRQSVNETWEGELRLQSRYQIGRLEILGFAGDTGADHLKHLQQLGTFLERVRF